MCIRIVFSVKQSRGRVYQNVENAPLQIFSKILSEKLKIQFEIVLERPQFIFIFEILEWCKNA